MCACVCPPFVKRQPSSKREIALYAEVRTGVCIECTEEHVYVMTDEWCVGVCVCERERRETGRKECVFARMKGFPGATIN